MKRIPLTQNQYALVDDEDYQELSKFNWYAAWNKDTKSFYVVRNIKKFELIQANAERMHRNIMDAPCDMVVDHINHDTLDNRRVNLRICTHSQNLMNRGKNRNNSSGYKGVYWSKAAGKWYAQIKVNRKSNYLGLFLTKEEAHKAYREASKKFHGEFGSI